MEGAASTSPTSESPAAVSLGEFLRARRERLTPKEAGLPAGGRRRTPGLRREELAMLADISVDYLTRLEQGRETNPSVAVLSSLGDALQLGAGERTHLKYLTGSSGCPEACPDTPPEAPVDPSTLALLERLHPTPAFVLELTGDVTAWNGAYRGLMEASGLFRLDPPNLLRYVFLVPEARTFLRDWDTVAVEQMGNLRAAAGRWPNDPAFPALIGELSMQSPDFAAKWACQDVGEKGRGTKQLDHPVAGELVLTYEAMLVPGGQERRLVTYLPTEQQSARTLVELAGTDEATASWEAGGPGPVSGAGAAGASSRPEEEERLRLVR